MSDADGASGADAGATAEALDSPADELAPPPQATSSSTRRSISTATPWAPCPAPCPPASRTSCTGEWGELRIRSWSESGWWTAPERIGDRIAPLVGAAPGQVVVGDSTSVNVFKAVVAAVRIAQGADTTSRERSLVDAATFPTDGYIAESAARMTGCTVRAVPAAEMADAAGPRTAVALVNHVDYRTGELHDLPPRRPRCTRPGATHRLGPVPQRGRAAVELDAHGVDLAVGCTYKYLNGGPGSPAFLYVRARVPAALRLAAARLDLARRPVRHDARLRARRRRLPRSRGHARHPFHARPGRGAARSGTASTSRPYGRRAWP